MKIKVFNNYGVLGFPYRKVVKLLQSEFTNRFIKHKEVSLIFINEEEIKRLNWEYRKIDKVTDVLSFPNDDAQYIGEIFIAVRQLKKQAEELKHSKQRECAFLITHGLLHLLGYDHQNELEEKEMFTLTEDILQTCGFRREGNG